MKEKGISESSFFEPDVEVPSFDRPYTFVLGCAAVVLFIISSGVNVFLFRYAQDSTISQLEKVFQENVNNLDLLAFSMVQGFERVQSTLEEQSLFTPDQVRENLTVFLAKHHKFYGKISLKDSSKSCILHGRGVPSSVSLQSLDIIGRFLSRAPKSVPYFLKTFPAVSRVSYVSKEVSMNCPWEEFPPVIDPEWLHSTQDILLKLEAPFLNNFPKWTPLTYHPYEKSWSVSYILPSFFDQTLKGFFIFDLSQGFFLNFLKSIKIPFGKAFLVDQENTIMAQLGKDETEGSSVSFLQDEIPPELMTDKNSIFRAPFGKMVYHSTNFFQGYWTCVVPLQKAPWKIVFIGTSWQIAKNDIHITFGDMITIVMTLVFMVGLSHHLMRSYFFKPALQLISHLNQERQGLETQIKALPPRWQPWGALISKTFSENRHLVTELESRVQERTKALKKALENLQESQKQIIAQEKLAGLGTLVAGIAHEMKNPLSFVINFAGSSREFIQELKKDKIGSAQAKSLLQDLDLNMSKIIENAERTDHIVKSMLLHARSGPAVLEETDLNRLLDEYIDLCHQSFVARSAKIPLEVEKNFDVNLPAINVYPQDIGRVFLNLLNNAFETVQSRFLKENAQESPEEYSYKPKVSVSTQNTETSILITIKDNGEGIPQETLKKIFDPFFTTKGPGKGTGLGLSISYDCVQRHRGSLDVESTQGVGSQFLIQIPKNLKPASRNLVTEGPEAK